MDRWAHGWMDGWMVEDGWMEGWMNSGWTNMNGQDGGWIGGWEDEWTVDGWDGWMHGQTCAQHGSGGILAVAEKQEVDRSRVWSQGGRLEDSSPGSRTAAGRARAGRDGACSHVPGAPAALSS